MDCPKEAGVQELRGMDRNRIQGRRMQWPSWHMTAKPTGTQPTVNAALVHRQFAHLPPGDLRRERRACGDIPGSGHTGSTRSKRCGALPAACDESAATHHRRAARCTATCGVMVQKSAEVSRSQQKP